MVYKLNEITIRQVTLDDLTEVSKSWESKEISLEKAKKVIDWMNNNHKLNKLHNIEHACFAIFENRTDKIVGWCGLDGRNDNLVKLFYLVNEEYRRKGYATLAAKSMLEYGFNVHKLDRIIGECKCDNTASVKILNKIGMNKIGEVDDTIKFEFLISDYNN